MIIEITGAPAQQVFEQLDTSVMFLTCDYTLYCKLTDNTAIEIDKQLVRRFNYYDNVFTIKKLTMEIST